MWAQDKPKVLWFIGMDQPGLHTFPFWARCLIRLVYFLTGYQAKPHGMAVATSEEIAVSMLRGPNYFAKPLPVDTLLREEPCAIGPVIWGNDEAQVLYQRYSPDGVWIPRRDWKALQLKVTDVCEATRAEERCRRYV